MWLEGLSSQVRFTLQEPLAEVQEDPLPVLRLPRQAEVQQEHAQGRVYCEIGEWEQLRELPI